MEVTDFYKRFVKTQYDLFVIRSSYEFCFAASNLTNTKKKGLKRMDNDKGEKVVDLVVNIGYEDYKSFSIYHSKKKLLSNFSIFFIVSFITYLYFGWSDGENILSLKYIGFGILIVAIISLVLITIEFFLLAHRAKSHYESNKIIKYEQHYVVTNENIKIHSEISSSTIDWENIFKISEGRHAFYLYISKAQVLLIPKRSFLDLDQINIFKELARNKMSSKKIKFIKR